MAATSNVLQSANHVAVLPGENELPFDDGVPMDSERHRKQMNLSTGSLELEWDDRNDFYVGGDMAIYFSHLQIKKNDFRGPDVFVVLDTVRRVRKSWVVWEENGRTPDVIIELLSATTEHVDRGEKMRIYAQLLHVANYYLFDPDTGVLEGYELDANTRAYKKMAPSPNGDLPCPALGLSLGVRSGVYHGVEGDWLRWIDPTGRVLPTSLEVAAEQQKLAADEREKRLDAERRLADALAQLKARDGSNRSG